MTLFSNRLKQIRTNKNLSIMELQEKVKKFTYKELYDLEYENTVPKFSDLICLADFFNCSIDYLIGLSDIKNPDPIVDLQNKGSNDISIYQEVIYRLEQTKEISLKLDKSMQSFIITPWPQIWFNITIFMNLIKSIYKQPAGMVVVFY